MVEMTFSQLTDFTAHVSTSCVSRWPSCFHQRCVTRKSEARQERKQAASPEGKRPLRGKGVNSTQNINLYNIKQRTVLPFE